MTPQPKSWPPLWQLKIPGTFSLLSHMLNIPSQSISLWLGTVSCSGRFPRSNLCSGGWSPWDSSCLLKPRAERCEVNTSYQLRENRCCSGSQRSPLQIHSIHHFHLTHLCNGHFLLFSFQGTFKSHDYYFDLLYSKLFLPTATGHAQISFLFFHNEIQFKETF